MATNLRLRPDAEAALREESARTGRSQQELIREAIDRFLDFGSAAPRTSIDELTARGLLKPPRSSSEPRTRIALPDGMTSLKLLEREDRL